MPGSAGYPWTKPNTLTWTRGCVMAWPMVVPAPVVSDPAAVFRDWFDNQCQFRHVQHDWTGLMVLPTQSLANMARCSLDSADTTNLARCLAEAPWREDESHRRRIRDMRQQTTCHRQRRREALVVLDESPLRTRGEPLGLYGPARHPWRRHLSPGPQPGHQRVRQWIRTIP